jgi:hypothetical protein
MPASEPVFLGLNEGTWFAIIALLLTMVISIVASVMGFLSGSRDRQSRYALAIQDRDHQTARIREQWEREDRLEQRTRVRNALIRDLHATRDQCVATLNLSVFQAMGGVDTAAQLELMGEKYANADVGLIGDKASAGLYLSVLGRLTAHQRGQPLGDELISASADAASAVKERIREQETRANRDERLQYVDALARADLPSEDRNSPMLLRMAQQRDLPVKWGRNPDV